ncbi:MAG: alcohol dehydrogenase catalytic domain-containing protein [Acidimicrobiia bacterium]|nr:alcohol dehydrogenase catalytic domain-containing protein [Acidimicrobiia bacterium]MYJ14463.1 alcohol dehydrogenase catalytic domain-containing protein [Acidimicrobiia bacterium]
MKAVQVTAPGRMAYADVAAPASGPEALVRVETVGICGTDVKILSGAISVSYPRVMGHEMVGEVVCGGATGVPAGQRVMIDPAVSCGSCPLCRQGRTNLCLRGGLLGRDADGVWAELVTAPASRLLPVPEHLGSQAAAMVQVAGTCVHAQRAAATFPGDVAVVIGLGVSGLIFTQLLRAAGASVIGVTRSAFKRELATAFGAVATAAPDEAAAVIAEVTDGAGVDLAVEAIGTEATVGLAIESARVGGEVLVFGTVTGSGGGLPYYQLYFKELTVHNPRAAIADDYARAIELAAAGVLDLEPVVTDRIGLAEVDRAFERVQSPDSLKVLMPVG